MAGTKHHKHQLWRLSILIKHCIYAASRLSNVVKTLLKFQTLSEIQSSILRHSDLTICVKCDLIRLVVPQFTFGFVSIF